MQKILNKLYPFDWDKQDLPTKYDQLQIELAIVLYNMKGVEGQSAHSENGVSRTYRSEGEILGEVIPMAGSVL